jgi:hypothetical protein
VSPLIFVDGVPGTGKSTTAQFIARQLTRHGRPARWIYEEEASTPFVPETPKPDYRDWDEFAQLHVERWSAFARDMADVRETVIVESFLLQRPIFTMLRRDADPSIIEMLVNRIAGTVASLDPTLIYLSHVDPAQAWRAIAVRRGAEFAAGAVRRSEEWPYVQTRGIASLDGMLAYWQAHGALCDKIVSWLPMHTTVIDVATGDWTERRALICERLGVPADDPPAPDPRLLARFTGTYRDGSREIVVALTDERLVLRGVLWPTNTLLPVTSDTFDVEAWPFQVRFDGDTLSWHGPRLWWGGPSGVFRRVID